MGMLQVSGSLNAPSFGNFFVILLFFPFARLLNLERDYDKIETNQAYLDVVKKGDLSSTKWFDLSTLDVAPNQVNVNIYYSALDYKDYQLAMGQLGTEYIERSIGTEFSGRRLDNGQRVMGLATGKAIATSIDTNPSLLVDVPPSWTLEDGAASINSTFLVWYSLINRAQLEEGETILVHPGTSANGLIALQVGQQKDCRIFATATSDEKRQYLIDQFGLNPDWIFNPNDAAFVDEILAATNGNGVDLVFDSSSPERMVTKFPIVSDYGRYIEVDNLVANPSGQIPRNTHYYNISSLISQEAWEGVMPKLFRGFAKWFGEGEGSESFFMKML